MQEAQTVQAKFWATTKPYIMVMPTRLDSGIAPDMEMNARNFIQSGAQNLVLDCAQTHNMTSVGLHAILTIAKLMQNVQGKLTVTNLQDQPKDMFQTCGFDQIVSVENEDATVEAIAA